MIDTSKQSHKLIIDTIGNVATAGRKPSHSHPIPLLGKDFPNFFNLLKNFVMHSFNDNHEKEREE